MTHTMSYKGYTARIEYDDDDGIFTGRIAGIRDGVSFHADAVEGLREAFHEAVEDYIETCAKIGKEPQKAFSGQVTFRISRGDSAECPYRQQRLVSIRSPDRSRGDLVARLCTK